MRSAFEISASEVMNEQHVTATTEESISQIKNKMEENRLRAIPVVDGGGNFEGVIGYRELVRYVQFNPEITAPKKMMHSPPRFKEDDSLVDLADLRINSGRKMLVAVEEGKLKGVIGDSEFLQSLAEAEELEDVSTRRLASQDLVTVDEDEILDRARHKMLDNNISRLPVTEKGELSGIIDSVDILKMIVKRERQPSGGTSGGRSGDEVKISGGTEREKLSDITVNQLMRENVSTSEDHLNGLEAVEKMQQAEDDVIVFTEAGKPEEIITLKDLLSRLAELAEQQTILVHLTGVELPEEKQVIHNKLKNQIQGSLGRKLEKPQELKLVIKKADKDGKKHRWELNIQLVSEYGVTTVKEEGWELLDAIDEALDELNRIIRDKHEKKTEHR